LIGKPAKKLLSLAEEWNADLIIGGSHERSAIGRFFLGSVSRSVAENAISSVRVVRYGFEKVNTEPIEIILGVRNPAEIKQLVETLATRIWPPQTRIRLIAVDDGASARADAAFFADGKSAYESAVERLTTDDVEVTVQIQSGDLTKVLLDFADDGRADAIFVLDGKADGRGLDVTAYDLITNAKCTVEIVR
jgi:nucleotide-binding universal stress UspA family protein